MSAGGESEDRCRGAVRPCALALALACVLAAGCAQSDQRLETNSIRDNLNRGGTEVSGAVRRFELAKFDSLSSELPICIAYRMPVRAPWLTGAFNDVLATLQRRAKPWKPAGVTVEILHSRFDRDTAGAFPAEIAVQVNEAMNKAVPGVSVRYTTIPMEQFRARASCGQKDTMFVDLERLTAYRSDYPSDLAWSRGSIDIRDVLFIRIVDTGTAAKVTADAR